MGENGDLDPGRERAWRTIERRDLRMQIFTIALLLFMPVVVVYNQIQFQMQTVAARQANVKRQEELKGYIKCILLMRYDNPELNANSPRADVERALDKCATVGANEGGDR